MDRHTVGALLLVSEETTDLIAIKMTKTLHVQSLEVLFRFSFDQITNLQSLVGIILNDLLHSFGNY